MKVRFIFLFFLCVMFMHNIYAYSYKIKSPDSKLVVEFNIKGGSPSYNIKYNDKIMLKESPLGFKSNIGDFYTGMKIVKDSCYVVNKSYIQNKIKKSHIVYSANKSVFTLSNAENKKIDIVFQVSNNDVAFKYDIPKQGETASIVILKEQTGFAFSEETTTFLTPQSDPMIGWKRTKPSYEEEYIPDAPLNLKSKYGHGFTFPALYHIGENGWVLISETGVDSKFCGSRLSDVDENGVFTVEYPMKEENNGNGTSEPGIALPGSTPWRTVTVSDELKHIVETTIPWNLVEPLYSTEHNYKFGRGTWSWIVWQDASINYDDQVKFIDLASELGYEYVLVDNWWDTNIGHDKMEKLVKYAKGKNVDVFLWYSSSGYWNDIEQGPVNIMDNAIKRKQEMKWLHRIGVKGIKVDFFGGDKQETMRLYESILSDADDNGLMVIFHGCTIPRGWERMYPNYVGSEAVLASENLIFSQHFLDNEAFNATLHPFIRNTIGCMEFGGTLLNKRMNKNNDGGTVRLTTDVFQIATAVLFQNPIQNFAITPNNLYDAPSPIIDFMKKIPTTWDDIKFIDGYPGKYCILARKHNDKWYIAGINAEKETLKLDIDLSMLEEGDKCTYYFDKKNNEVGVKDINIKNNKKFKVELQPNGGFVIFN